MGMKIASVLNHLGCPKSLCVSLLMNWELVVSTRGSIYT